MAKPVMITTSTRSVVLSVLAVVAVAVITIVVVENTPERQMDRRYDKLLRSYDEPEQLYQRLVDDGDLFGFLLVNLFLSEKELGRCDCGTGSSVAARHTEDCNYRIYMEDASALWYEFRNRMDMKFCDCKAGSMGSLRGVHAEDCRFILALQDSKWESYVERKNKEFREREEVRLTR